jgi:CheY-like chemotaxis protein
VPNSRGEMMFSNKTQSGRQPLILCVDDDPKGLYFRTLILEESGYKVFASAHPAQSLMIIEHEFVNIALVDYQMPDMNGAELSAFIKKKTPRTRIIMLSGCSHIPEGDLASVDFFVSKGDGMSRVLEIISDLLKEERDPHRYSIAASAC